MKKITLFAFVIFLSACASFQPARSTSSTKESAIYLNTEDYSSKAQTLLLETAEGKHRPPFAEAQTWIESYTQSDSYSKIIAHYSEELYSVMKINPEKSEAWKKKNPRLYKGIHNYVGDSSDSDAEPTGPTWQTINSKFWNKEAFTDEDKTFVEEINYTLANLPQVKGLVFRGKAMTDDEYKKIAVGKPWLQAAYTSTSLDYGVAESFGYAAGKTYSVVLILKVKSGSPVSPLTFDMGYQGQPGRFHEYEVLLSPGRELFIHHKVTDPANTTCYIFAEEL